MKLISKRKLPNRYKRYDLSIEGHHNFVSEGIVVHNTSAHISWKLTEDGTYELKFFPGGESYDNFVAIFNQEDLKEKLTLGGYNCITVYGEAYGGRCQGMKATYGDKLRFVAFEVLMGEHSYLPVPTAHKICTDLGLDFVHYERGPCTLEWLDTQRDAPSVQAVKNGMGEGKLREGIVIRPVVELRKNSGERIIAKHKGEAFSEFNSAPRPVESNSAKEKAEADALHWVTPMRLQHVLDTVAGTLGIDVYSIEITHTRDIITAMIEDVERESKNELEMTKELKKAVGNQAAKVFKQYLQNRLRDNDTTS